MAGEQNQVPAPKPVDTEIFALEDGTQMRLSFTITRPEHGGEDITMEKLRAKLTDLKVNYGVEETALERLVKEKPYGQAVIVARGLPAEDGADGKCEELFARTVKPSFKERSDGTVDFKEMNLIVNVAEGEVICRITPPTPGEEGRTIHDAVLRPRPGRPAIVPQGENTRISEDGLALVAAVAGSLVFRRNKFCVDSVLTVDGDVDNSIGNITFDGDVVVRGNVQEGYTIRSKGNVTVKGAVEGADIYADGSITLEKGINGMNHGTLTAKGNISSPYIENCKISSGGNVLAESIVNCSVEADGNLEMHGKRAIIAGGKCTVFGSLKANAIGSRSAVQTTVTLGVTPTVMREKAQLEKQLREMRNQSEEAAKNLYYLERCEADNKLTGERKAALNRLRIQGPILKMKIDKMSKELEALDNKIREVGNCVLTCKRIYPPTKIWIGNASLVVQDICENARVFRNSDGELTIGKF